MDRIINRTPENAIIAKCFDCCGKQREEVKLCTILDCPLFQYRLGLDEKSVKQAMKPIEDYKKSKRKSKKTKK